jgi:hypothetical protein
VDQGNSEKVKNIIGTKVIIPISIENVNYLCPVELDEAEKFLGEHADIETHYYTIIEDINAYYISVFGWIRANPSEPGLKEAMDSVFVWNNEHPTKPTNTVNTKFGNKQFKNDIINNKTNTIFLIGKRGSGKTYYLNYFLNNETFNLYDDNNMVWYRVDASKIYKHNQTYPDKPWSISDYLRIQIPYVTFKYKHNAALWKEIVSLNTQTLHQLIRDLCMQFPSLKKGVPKRGHKFLCKEYEDLVKVVAEKDDLTKSFVNSVINDSKRKHFNDLLYLLIMEYTSKQRYRPIIIFDGIDNIDYNTSSNLYFQFMSELTEFCKEDDLKKHQYNALHIIALRNDTYFHLNDIRPDFFNQKYTRHFVEPPDVKTVFELKANVAKAPTAAYFMTKKTSIDFDKAYSEILEVNPKFPFKKMNDVDSVFDDFCRSFGSAIIEAINKVVGEKYCIKDMNELLETFYNGNMRALIHNFINIFRYKMLWLVKREHVKKEPSFILVEGQLLNGRLWLNSAQKKRRLGDCIPNIFWFQEEHSNGRWHGLCLYRLLQTLRHKPQSREDILIILNNKFKYSKIICEERFQTCLSYGLIESKFKKKQEFCLTKKGIFFLAYPFLDVNIFYYMAIDTPLSEEVVYHTNKVRLHDNSGKYWENFSEACILTSITLIRHILSQSHCESMASNGPESEIYSLPNNFPTTLIDGMNSHCYRLNNMSKGGKIRLKTLLEDLEGLV